MEMKLISDRMRYLGSENAFRVGDDIKRCEQAGTRVIRLNLGEPDFDTAPFINREAIKHINLGHSHYCAPEGIESFRRAVAQQLSETRGISIDPRLVVVTTGAKPAIGYALMTYVNPGDEVIYPSPGFPIYESWITFVRAKPVPLHLKEKNGFCFTADDLEKRITRKTKLVFINSPSNPTGGVLSQACLSQIAEVLLKKASPFVRVFSDEVYEQILFDGLKHCSIISEKGMIEKTILVSGLSKTFAMTGWRLGYALLPTVQEAELFKDLNINHFSCTPHFIQEAGREALENPKSLQWVAEKVKEFEKRRNYIVSALNTIPGIACVQPKGAFYVFPNIQGVCQTLGMLKGVQKGLPSTLFQKFLLFKYGVATIDRPSFGKINSKNEHFIRLSTAANQEELQEGMKRISSAAQDQKGFSAFLKSFSNL